MEKAPEKVDIQEAEEISKMLKILPAETRKGFYYAIKGACLMVEGKAVISTATKTA